MIRVLTPGGPYLTGQRLSLAFVDPSIGRLAAHDTLGDPTTQETRGAGLVPESISAALTCSAGAYECDEVLTLSFVDPALVRIHASPGRRRADLSASTRNGATAAIAPGIILRSRWSGEDSCRFVAVIDKLFTVERLGWYRHSLAMRMLLPDEILVPNSTAGDEVATRLAALRSAATEALGAPLLGALIPQFSVSAEWLESIETPALVKALAGLREAIAPYVSETSLAAISPESKETLTGTIRSAEYQSARNEGADAFLPLLIPERSTHEGLSQRLHEYRSALIELFGQTARTAAAVRLKQMTLPNHVLDDRLWNLAGALQDAFDDRTIA
jgi:hypothetical protein